MNAFYTLPPLLRSMFATMLFVAVIGETALLIYKAHRSVRFAEKLVSLLALFILFAALILFPQYGDADTGLCRLPWIPVAVLLFLAAIHLSIAIPMERKRLFERITPDSIREATNALTMGICFADPAGRIILCNETMRELSYMMTGSYPQMIGELDTVLFPAGPDGKRSSNGTFFFPDGNVRLFNSEQITVSGEKGWRQITAQDITELHRVKEQLESENRRLAETNRKLRAMYDRMTDDIREKESLEMKIRTHDTIGRSLITIQDIMENADEADKKLAALRDAVSVLSASSPQLNGDIADEVKNCEKLGIKLILKGYMPHNTRLEQLVVAAIRECATNCVRHAHGTYVAVNLQERHGICSVTITNDGEKPKGKIIEGSGLSSLRRSVESMGGEMLTAYSPVFALLLNLPITEDEIW